MTGVSSFFLLKGGKRRDLTPFTFSKGAHEYANNLNGTTALVLIDGIQLAKYIYDFNLGMQVEKVMEIKKLDSEFWDLMADA